MRHRNPILLTLLALVLLLGATATYATYTNVELNYFIGRRDGDVTVLRWQTASEIDNSGFYVWRSEEDLPINLQGTIDTTRAVRLNSQPIQNPNPDNICGLGGQDYSYIDTTVDPNRTVYYYYLESLPCTTPASVFYGDEMSGLEVIQRFTVYLPLVMDMR